MTIRIKTFELYELIDLWINTRLHKTFQNERSEHLLKTGSISCDNWFGEFFIISYDEETKSVNGFLYLQKNGGLFSRIYDKEQNIVFNQIKNQVNKYFSKKSWKTKTRTLGETENIHYKFDPLPTYRAKYPIRISKYSRTNELNHNILGIRVEFYGKYFDVKDGLLTIKPHYLDL